MEDCFARERELCFLFKRRNEAPSVSMDFAISNKRCLQVFTISNKSVDIIVFHKEGIIETSNGEKRS